MQHSFLSAFAAALLLGTSLSAVPVVQSLSLVDTTTNQPVASQNPMLPNATLNQATLPAGLSIIANVTGTNSVLFTLDSATHLDPKGPSQSLCGDNDAAMTYVSCSNLTVGTHTLTATPYSGRGGTGTVGATYTLPFTIIDESAIAIRKLYAINQSGTVGSIAVYNIDAGHQLLKTITPVTGIRTVWGVVADAASGRLFVSYANSAGAGSVFALNLYTEQVIWNRTVPPNVDRLAISRDGTKLYVPTGEGTNANYLNILDAATGNTTGTVTVSNHLHDADVPLSGPLFLTTHAPDASGNYLYQIDETTSAVTPIGPYSGMLGPFAVDRQSHYAVNNVQSLWGFQIADLTTNQVSTAFIPNPPAGDPQLLHGIAWTPDQTEVWMSGATNQVYVWDMTTPAYPTLKQTITLPTGSNRPHWITFNLNGQYGYVAPNKSVAFPTQVISVATHTIVSSIASSEDLVEIDFAADGHITAVSDQYGIGRAAN